MCCCGNNRFYPKANTRANMKKQVLITGSSRGIGKAIALRLAKNNYEIILHCNSNFEEAKKVKQEIETCGNNAVRILQFDVNNREQCCSVLSDDVQQHGIYYAIVCNAGITADAPFPILEAQQWDSVVNTSLNGFYNVVRPLVMEMVSAHRPGRIVTISSISGLIGNRGQVNYSAAKAGIIGATKALALELAKHKITVNSIAPGLIDTDMTKGLNMEEIKKHIPMRRTGTPDEVASLVEFLLCEDAAYITRQVISINGGLF